MNRGKWMLIIGLILAIIGLVISYSKLSFIPESFMKEGGYTLRVGLVFCIWGIFNLIRDRNKS